MAMCLIGEAFSCNLVMYDVEYAVDIKCSLAPPLLRYATLHRYSLKMTLVWRSLLTSICLNVAGPAVVLQSEIVIS